MYIKYEWDEAKRARNLEKHGVDFAEIERFDWNTAIHAEDDRHDYGEVRIVSAGVLDDRLHICAWTPRGDMVRIITLRKANGREQAAYRRARASH